MTLTASVLVGVLGLLLVLGTGGAWWQQRPPTIGRRVLLNLASDDSLALAGVHVRTRGSWFVLADAAVVQRNGTRTTALGELVVHRANVSFAQLVTRDAGSSPAPPAGVS